MFHSFSSHPPSVRPLRARRRGAALVEFAMCAMLLCAMLLMLLQYGAYLSVTNRLWTLSREGARFAAVQKLNEPNYPKNVEDFVKSRSTDTLSWVDSKGVQQMFITVSPSNSADLKQGTPVTVTINYNLASKTFVSFPGFNKTTNLTVPGLPPLKGNFYTTQTTMRVEGN